MIEDKTPVIWKTIDAIIMSESTIEVCYSKLLKLGFPKKEVNDILECFVVDKIKKLMED